MEIKKRLAVMLALCFMPVLYAAPAPAPVQAQTLPPVEGFTAEDMPGDSGNVALLKWKRNHSLEPGTMYQVMVSTSSLGPWKKLSEMGADKNLASAMKLPFWMWHRDNEIHAYAADVSSVFDTVSDKDPYYFKLVEVKDAVSVESQPVQAVVIGNWFNMARINNMFFVIIVCAVFLWTISHAKRKELFIRRIAGLDAVDEAIGRATEMGRPIYYTTGLGSMAAMSTIASSFVLGEISKKVASYDATIKVPHYDPMVMTVCREVVRQSYTEAGRPDSYRDDINFFVSQDQFSFVASVDGMISREKPAACFFIGSFMAESLLLTEVGCSTGAIQVAGTDEESQLPFFFTSCDYTLIGEELYAAGAYLSKDPILVGTLRAQDMGKAFVMIAVAVGIILTTLGVIIGSENMVHGVFDPFHSF